MKLSSVDLPTAKEIQQEKSRRRLTDFTTYTMPDYKINWHHENLCHALDKMARRELKRLMVFMPPRHGKSELVSRRFPAYVLGRDPNANVIGASYSADLASSMNRDVQRIIDTPGYRELFPETTLNGTNVKTASQGSYLRNSEGFEIVGHKGNYKSAGVNGPITGFGADFAIIDDPVKNRQDAESKAFRDRLDDWFSSTLYTRLEEEACILITLTRWHEDDLAGRLLARAANNPDAEQWEVIRYPAVFDEKIEDKDPTDPRENGQALWPGKYDEKRLKTTKATVGSYDWSALYQQVPTPSEGGILKRHYFMYYKHPPNVKKFDQIIQSWDMTFKDKKGSDFVVGQVWGRIGADKYLLDQVRDRLDFSATVQAVRNLTAKWPSAHLKLIEDKANGPAVMTTLKKQINGLVPVEPNGSKLSRAFAITPDLEAGNIYIPDPSLASWTNDFLEECAAFPNSTNDDQVDCMSQGVYRLMTTTGKKPKVKVRST
ncbi:phage terminase large subunit [Marinococcus luteus]|uniref:phage terminase large subunit n=1 Tax=Marinococcus luteus TaxID=1122204 RepID=UPI002ACC681A|nr:phage terminase large subunit [Marinococcus luteus]MDZ5782100.1 phage terminase large subunit [Marinococcus luteus]